MSIRILVADDHSVVRSGLRSLLEADPDLEVVGEARDGIETLRRVEELRPDLVLLDISMPPESGIETATRLKEEHPEVLVLFLTMHEEASVLHAALATGASGFVIKRADEAEILAAIHAASRGDIWVSPAMTRALFRLPVEAESRPGARGMALTRREVEVLRLLSKGNTNRQVADLLGISIRTVETHRANLMGKLGAVSRVDLVNYAEEHDLL